eukprot:4071260-Pleurochrysis_carterae.AAC.1
MRDALRIGVRLGGDKSSSCVCATALLFVALRTTLWAVFVPVGPLAPAARGPLVTPFLVWFWTWPLGVCILRSLLLSADGESVRSTRVQLEFAANVSHFCIAENAARRVDSER